MPRSPNLFARTPNSNFTSPVTLALFSEPDCATSQNSRSAWSEIWAETDFGSARVGTAMAAKIKASAPETRVTFQPMASIFSQSILASLPLVAESHVENPGYVHLHPNPTPLAPTPTPVLTIVQRKTTPGRMKHLLLAATLAALSAVAAQAQPAGDPVRPLFILAQPQAAAPREYQAAEMVADAWKSLGLEVTIRP